MPFLITGTNRICPDEGSPYILTPERTLMFSEVEEDIALGKLVTGIDQLYIVTSAAITMLTA